jgi:hypothetical protein
VGPYGVINASAARTRIDSHLYFSSGSKVYLTKSAASLAFLGDTEYRGGTFTGNGVLYQVGDAVIAEGQTVQIDTATYQWDGEGWLGVTPPTSHTTIEPYAQLKITKNITNLGSDGYDGVVTVKEGAVLDLDRAWQLDGVICLQGGTVKGGTITVSSTGSILGWGTIEADVVNGGTIYCSGSVAMTGTVTNHGVVTSTCPTCP